MEDSPSLGGVIGGSSGLNWIKGSISTPVFIFTQMLLSVGYIVYFMCRHSLRPNFYEPPHMFTTDRPDLFFLPIPRMQPNVIHCSRLIFPPGKPHFCLDESSAVDGQSGSRIRIYMLSDNARVDPTNSRKKSGGKQGHGMTQRGKISIFPCCVIPCPCFPPDFFLEFVDPRVHYQTACISECGSLTDHQQRAPFK